MAASTTLATVTEVLKEVYEDRMVDQLQSEVITLKRVEKTSEGVSEDVGGKYVKFSIKTRRNHGVGARLENEPLPRPRTQKYATPQVSLAYLYGAASLTGQTLKLAETKPQSFISALEEELSGLKQTLVKDTNRQIYGTSLGILGAVASGTTSVTHTVDTGQYFEPGMIVDILSSDGATVRASEVTIEDVSLTTPSVTFATSVTSTTGDVITRWDSYGKEMIGFKEIVLDSGTLYGISPTTEPLWKSIVNSNGGTPRAISEGAMIQMIDDIRTKGGETTVIFTTLGVRRSYFNLLSQQRRYNQTKEFAGGFNGLGFVTDNGEVPIVSDFDCQKGRMYFMNEKALKFYQAGDWAFMDMDGSKWQRVITPEGNFDAYECMMAKYGNLGTKRRNSHGLYSDVQEATS